MREGDKAAQVGVALLALGEQCQVDWPALLIDQPVGQGELDSSDRLYASRCAGLGELHGAVEAVVVGDCQGLVAELGGADSELFGQRGAFEERETGMQMQLGRERLHNRSRTEVLPPFK